MGTRVSEDFQFWISGSRNNKKRTYYKPSVCTFWQFRNRCASDTRVNWFCYWSLNHKNHLLIFVFLLYFVLHPVDTFLGWMATSTLKTCVELFGNKKTSNSGYYWMVQSKYILLFKKKNIRKTHVGQIVENQLTFLVKRLSVCPYCIRIKTLCIHKCPRQFWKSDWTKRNHVY